MLTLNNVAEIEPVLPLRKPSEKVDASYLAEQDDDDIFITPRMGQSTQKMIGISRTASNQLSREIQKEIEHFEEQDKLAAEKIDNSADQTFDIDSAIKEIISKPMPRVMGSEEAKPALA